jgi:hypothetical protein
MLSTGVIALALVTWRRRRLKSTCSARPSRRS